jgi:hypothetical protein
VTTALRKFWDQLPTPTATILGHLSSLIVGLLAAIVLHYVLYRIGLPSKPFIYVAF